MGSVLPALFSGAVLHDVDNFGGKASAILWATTN
jgi:hypothetical protein